MNVTMRLTERQLLVFQANLVQKGYNALREERYTNGVYSQVWDNGHTSWRVMQVPGTATYEVW